MTHALDKVLGLLDEGQARRTGKAGAGSLERKGMEVKGVGCRVSGVGCQADWVSVDPLGFGV